MEQRIDDYEKGFVVVVVEAIAQRIGEFGERAIAKDLIDTNKIINKI